MSEYIVNVPDEEAECFVARFGVEGVTLFGYSLTGEIVRCGDCAKWATERRLTGRCCGPKGDANPDGFCAWGERRETMISWERFREAELALKIAAAEKWQVTDIACPDCGEPLLKDTAVALTTHPPKSKYKCKQCGFTGTA